MPSKPIILALCESAHIIPRPGKLYIYEVRPGCVKCAELASVYSHEKENAAQPPLVGEPCDACGIGYMLPSGVCDHCNASNATTPFSQPINPQQNQNTHEHTPGPWIHTPFNLLYLTVHADSGDPHYTRGRICQVDAVHPPSVLGAGRERAECEANARLIAAAPDLLAALEHVKHCCAAHDAWFLGEFANEVNAAIAKARP